MNVSLTKLSASLATLLAGALVAPAAVSLSVDWSSDPGSPPIFGTGSSGDYRVTASGDGFIGATSYSGSNHAEIALINDSGGGTFTSSFGQGIAYNTSSWVDSSNFGFNPASSFVNNATSSVWVFFDNPNAPSAYGVGDGWFWQPTLQNSAGDGIVDAGGFGVEIVDVGSGVLEWQVAADGIGTGFQDGLQFGANPDNGATAWSSGSVFNINSAAAGWYLLETIWMLNGSAVDQISRIYDDSDNLVYQATIAGAVGDVSGAGDQGVNQIGTVADHAGKTYYSGVTPGTSLMFDLAIDDITVVPEPTTYAIFLGLFSFVAILWRRFKQ